NPEWQVDLADISTDALALARENIARQQVGTRVTAIHSDLFGGLQSRRYDLIVSNPPYVTGAEYEALPVEYEHEPRLGLIAGEDGLDLCVRILDAAAEHLTEQGLLVVEVGESEHALMTLLPQLPFAWIDFKVGAMGVFALERHDLVEHADAIHAVAGSRR
ncbi:MAG: HemK family protein methyltransferase, partial [Rhodanobacter sp.]